MLYEKFSDLKYKYRNEVFVDTVEKNGGRNAEYIANQRKEGHLEYVIKSLLIPLKTADNRNTDGK